MWMNDYTSFTPWMGFFRLARGKRRHSEQHAPREWTLGNIAKMKAR